MARCPICNFEVVEGAEFCPYCGEKLGGDVDPYIGRTINGSYLVQELIGSGAIGRVYLAQQLSLSKPVAIKLLRRNLAENREVNERFQREALAASRLEHPNSITVIDFGRTEEGDLFLVTEFINGTDLCEVIQSEGYLAAERVLSMMIQVCSALVEAHAQGVIHRDIKPENIMVVRQRDGRELVKVLDFGIAQVQVPSLAMQPRLTRYGMVCGTPEYMSPEQARGEDLDTRTDVYSLGVVMYEALTGSLPFDGESAMDIISMHINDEPEPPSRRRPDAGIPQAVEAVCLKAMAKKREHRFQSILEMQRAMQEVFKALDMPHDVGQTRDAGMQADMRAFERVHGTMGTPASKGKNSLRQVSIAGIAASVEPALSGEQAQVGNYPASSGLELDTSALQRKRQPARARTGMRRMTKQVVSVPFWLVVVTLLLVFSGFMLARAMKTMELPLPVFGNERTPDVVKFSALPEGQQDMFRKANMLMLKEEWRRALRLLLKLSAAQPKFAEAYRKIGMCYLKLGRTKPGLAALQKYLKMAPHGERARQVRRLIQENGL